MNKNSTAVDLRKYGLETGNTQIKSLGPMVFSPQGILFIGWMIRSIKLILKLVKLLVLELR